jgi:hypothetical protein
VNGYWFSANLGRLLRPEVGLQPITVNR